MPSLDTPDKRLPSSLGAEVNNPHALYGTQDHARSQIRARPQYSDHNSPRERSEHGPALLERACDPLQGDPRFTRLPPEHLVWLVGLPNEIRLLGMLDINLRTD
jgi:hypothetical protein